MQKFIVKVKRSEGCDYWLAEGEGVTDRRSEAYKYTRQELQNHSHRWELLKDPLGGSPVLIPVKG